MICRPPRACSWLERSTCWVMVRIFSALFMMSSEPRACSAVAAAICCTVSAMRPMASVTCLRALGLLDGGAGDGAHHVGRLLRALEDLLQRALGLVRDLDAAVDVVRAALDGGDGVLRLGLDGLDEVGDLLGAGAGALGEVLDLVGDDREALAVLAGLRGDDGGVEREQVGLLGDVVDDVRGSGRWRRCAKPRLEMTATASWLDSLMR